MSQVAFLPKIIVTNLGKKPFSLFFSFTVHQLYRTESFSAFWQREIGARAKKINEVRVGFCPRSNYTRPECGKAAGKVLRTATLVTQANYTQHLVLVF